MRLIDADAMKELWQGCEIKGSISSLLDARPTVEAVPMSAIEDIKTEIDNLTIYYISEQGTKLISKNAVYRCFNLILNGSRDISRKE